MKKNKRKEKCGKKGWFFVGGALTIAGFLLVPPVIEKYGRKAYKRLLNEEEIDFDDMGPEIIPFSEEEKEYE